MPYRPLKLLFLLLLLCSKILHAQEPAKKGWLTVTENFSPKDHMLLNGEWEFYWQQLLDSSHKFPARPDAYSTLPQLWEDISINGKQLPPQGYASYRLKLILPKKLQNQAALIVPDFYTSYKLLVNGKQEAAEGLVGTSKETSEPHWNGQIALLRNLKDTNELVLQVSNFVHAKGGVSKNIELGSSSYMVQRYKRNLGQDIFLGGCLFMGAIFFFALFFFSRSEKPILYFAIFCLVYSYRIMGSDYYALHNIFPGLSFFLTLRLEYITLCLGSAFFIMYIRGIYPEEDNLLISYLLILISMGYAAIIAVTPTIVFTNYVDYYLFLLLLYIIYGIVIFIRAWKNKRPGAKYGIWSCVVAASLFIYVITNYFNLIPHFKLFELVCFILFFFFQSLILSNRSSYKLTQAKEEAEKGLKTKSQFLSTMSHEIRTPLNAVIGISQLLQKDNKNLTEQQKEYVDTLSFSGNNLMVIVNDILDYGKLDANMMQLETVPMSLKELATKICRGFKKTADDKHIELLLEIDERIPPHIGGDPTRSSQVFVNLLSNAIKFTDKGHVKFKLRRIDVGNSGNCTVEFTVEDTGIGICGNKLPLIFEPFTQADSSTSRSYGGTGLGLSIVKNILKMQGVTLLVKSEPGKGSHFSFVQTFPIVKVLEQQADKQLSLDEEKNSFAGKAVLLAEDNSVNVLVARKLLEKWGIHTDVAVNGKEAVEKFNPSRHSLVLMDLNMPEMDGYEAARTIRNSNKDIPIIALTANIAEEVSSDVLKSGMNFILTKPFSQQDLKNTLIKYIKAG
ncbi:MAG: response regulator [Ferruginibacter sp.]